MDYYFWRNVDDPFLAGGVEDLVGVGFVLPGGRAVLLSLAPHTVVEGKDGVWNDISPGKETFFCTGHRGLTDFHH